MPTDQLLDSKKTLAEFLDAAAARQPAPGGGSVTALVGAPAATMGEMLVNYSIGKKELAPHEPALREVLAELNRARRVMVEMMVEDQAAFAALSAARKSAKGQGDRDPTFAVALLACIRIPQTVAATAAAVLELCGRVTPIGNRFLLSDLAVCAELSMATIRCAAYNVIINLPDVSDENERERFERATAEVVVHATSRIRQVVPAIWQRLSEPA